jgi:hypothetical protein
MNTTTTQWFNVSNGDSTNHNSQLIVDSNSPIVINSAEIQWEGVSTSGSNTDYSRNTNSDSATAYRDTNYYTAYSDNNNYATATSETTTETKTKINSYSETWVNAYGGAILVVPYSNSGDFIKSVITYELNPYAIDHGTTDSVSGYVGFSSNNKENYEIVSVYGGKGVSAYTKNGTITSYDDSNNFVYLEYNKDETIERLDFDIKVTTYYSETVSKTGYASATYPSVPNGYSFESHRKVITGENSGYETYFSNKVGESVQVSASNGSTDLRLETTGTDRRSNTTTKSRTASTSYPSVPSGYSFDRHYYNIDGNSGYHYTNKVGQSESSTSNNTSDTVTVTLKTRGSKQIDVTYNTKSPSVSGDVSGDSGNITLENGVSSNWYTLNGLGSDSKAFNHLVEGNNEARFRFKFDWEYTVPTAIKEAEININGTNHRIALAEPEDSALQYDFYRTYVDGVGVLCFDVVDTSESGTIPYYVYHPTHGKLALRKII